MTVYSFEPGTGNNLSGVYDLFHTGWQLTVMEVVERLNSERPSMNPEDVFPGMRVKYAPSPGHWFEGMVAMEPWKLGDSWVTKLVDMEEGYAKFTGKSGDKAYNVYAASLHAIKMAGETMARPSTGHPDEPTKYRCNICGGVVQYDGTAPVSGNWGGRA